eukprot:scaffold273131_cov36-Tisochrysis_lutea.AAC.2
MDRCGAFMEALKIAHGRKLEASCIDQDYLSLALTFQASRLSHGRSGAGVRQARRAAPTYVELPTDNKGEKR